MKLGRYSLTERPDAAFALRALCFRGGASDRDALDALCQHPTVTDTATGTTVAAFRIQLLPDAAALRQSYAARFYDLARLAALSGPFLELGRFCLHPDWHDPDILRLAWAGLTRIVDAHGVTLLFGCTSFSGTDPAPHLDAFAHLAARHRAPSDRAPLQGADALDYPALTRGYRADPKQGVASLPPLLRTYLAMGGWVSDHAVIDRDLNTLHVFTGVEIARIPPARARLLRALATMPD
ncbi:GNAT family N-acetyltransferase [Gemmobacter straminiformis]|uniref:L-ornithine N(alpha)-acyltransferase n=1 Tax=Paragemmobacter straminiformis TaxID=2045119 RepID=A0A842I6V6_9RHOB|nr:GNAT family N-acyltransferase [Gemmobacter straminiformis]MBC2835580.1 GNAT family N-acetyltransferase [Gemmobacter straminiformis]